MHGIVESWLGRGRQQPVDTPPPSGPQAPAASRWWAVWQADGALCSVWHYPVPYTADAVRTCLDPLFYSDGDSLEPVSEARARELSARTAANAERSTRIAGGFSEGGYVPNPRQGAPGDVRQSVASAAVEAAQALLDRSALPEGMRGQDWPEPPDYQRPPTRTGELLLQIDEQIAGSLATRNQLLRRQHADALDRARRAEARVAELELTVGALGGKLASAEKAIRLLTIVMRHAAGHGEGGESDG